MPTARSSNLRSQQDRGWQNPPDDAICHVWQDCHRCGKLFEQDRLCCCRLCWLSLAQGISAPLTWFVTRGAGRALGFRFAWGRWGWRPAPPGAFRIDWLACVDPDQDGNTRPSIATSLPANGDPAGIRKWLAGHGVAYQLIYTNDVLSNVRGGLRRGTIDQGKLEAILGADLEKAAGLQGLSFFANVFAIHNTGFIRRDYVGGINTIAEIEAVPTIRLSELWLEQKLGNGNANLRVGQLAADVEFFFSGTSERFFLQSDWPTITAVDLPSGGPAYPLSTPGVRLKIDPTRDTSLLFAAFNGDPAGPGVPGDEQLRNRYGLNFRVQDPAFLMAEGQFRRNQRPEDTGLATTLKLGAWSHLGQFDDQRFAIDGSFLAGPLGAGVAARWTAMPPSIRPRRPIS